MREPMALALSRWALRRILSRSRAEGPTSQRQRHGLADTRVAAGMLWPDTESMATMTVKSTYALDIETGRTLEDMARRWGVSKSEALRRAIRAAKRGPAGAPKALTALDALQRLLSLKTQTAARRERQVRAERRATSIRRESR